MAKTSLYPRGLGRKNTRKFPNSYGTYGARRFNDYVVKEVKQIRGHMSDPKAAEKVSKAYENLFKKIVVYQLMHR